MKSGILIITKKSALVKTCKVQGDWWSCKKVPLYVRKKKNTQGDPIYSACNVIFQERCGLAEARCVPDPGVSTRPVSGFRLPGRSSEMKRHLCERKAAAGPPAREVLSGQKKRGIPALWNTFDCFLPCDKTWSCPVGAGSGTIMLMNAGEKKRGHSAMSFLVFSLKDV